MAIKIKGFNELERKLRDLSRRAQEIDGNNSVPLSDLLSENFIRGCSRFSSVDEMFQASGFEIGSQEDFAAIPDDKWDEFIRGNTSYPSWNDMLTAAGEAWVRKKIGL